MRGSPYSTARWQKTRLYVIARDPLCTIQGPRCRIYSSTAHHILPSSSHPHLFFALDNLAGACGPCNYAEGAAIASSNRRAHATAARLERIIEEQADEIAELRQRLEEYEHPRKRAEPAIR